jgi:hypothetical protein
MGFARESKKIHRGRTIRSHPPAPPKRMQSTVSTGDGGA